MRYPKTTSIMLSTLVLAALPACGSTPDDTAQPESTDSLTVVSSRPDMVTGGSALIAVPNGDPSDDIRVTVGGTEIATDFRPSADGSLVGLIEGLQIGSNDVTVDADGKSTSIELINHDLNGPIISGPHQEPFMCQTDAFQLPDGSTLGPAADENCNAPTKVSFVYKPVGGADLLPLPSTTDLPDDIATTTTSDGETVKYIVRVETGTINRAIYQTAVLFDPTKDPEPDPHADYEGWNRKAIFVFGGSAAAGYQQGNRLGAVSGILTEDAMLSRGFAVMASTLNVMGTNSNDALSAETASMVKEHFIKSIGTPTYLMGWGGSGGSMQQHLIANNYPGILDGIVPGSSFSDLHSIVPSVQDCSLLDRAFADGSEQWTDAQKTAVSGYNTWATCQSWMSLYSPHWMEATQHTNPMSAGVVDTSNCPHVLPKEVSYDPITNPEGARCDIYSGAENLVGIDPATGHAARGFDNVGVEYGFEPYRQGVISPEQFVQLNERAGGYDSDGQFQTERTIASPVALDRLYGFGRINDGSNLGDIPIIDQRSDPGMKANVHDSVRSLTTRARLIRANGDADNQIIVRSDSTPPPPGSGASPEETTDFVLEMMDQWLSSIAADHQNYDRAHDKVVANKPGDLADTCVTAEGEMIRETADTSNSGRCGTLLPFHENPRMIAGGPLTDDVLKCSLTPLQRSEYANLSDSQFTRLNTVFADGVCDYSVPGVGAQPLKSTWLAYEAPGMATPLAAG